MRNIVNNVLHPYHNHSNIYHYYQQHFSQIFNSRVGNKNTTLLLLQKPGRIKRNIFAKMIDLRDSTMAKKDENNKERWTQMFMRDLGYLPSNVVLFIIGFNNTSIIKPPLSWDNPLKITNTRTK